MSNGAVNLVNDKIDFTVTPDNEYQRRGCYAGFVLFLLKSAARRKVRKLRWMKTGIADACWRGDNRSGFLGGRNW